MNPERLNQLWSDPQNYRGSVYRCKEDPRVVVPKRKQGTGWTLNFAHSRAWWVLASMPLAVLLPADRLRDPHQNQSANRQSRGVAARTGMPSSIWKRSRMSP